jgi:hypothetical protein
VEYKTQVKKKSVLIDDIFLQEFTRRWFVYVRFTQDLTQGKKPDPASSCAAAPLGGGALSSKVNAGGKWFAW